MYPGDLLCILVTPQSACQGGACPRGGIHQGSACPGQPPPPTGNHPRPVLPARAAAKPAVSPEAKATGLSPICRLTIAVSTRIVDQQSAPADFRSVAPYFSAGRPGQYWEHRGAYHRRAARQNHQRRHSRSEMTTGRLCKMSRLGSMYFRATVSEGLVLSAPASWRLRDCSRHRHPAGFSRLQALALVFRPGPHRRYRDQGGSPHRPGARSATGRAR